jgi:RNA polymerase sigma factor (sigma-70 family)
MISGDRSDLISHDNDYALAQAVANGSTAAWHQFLETYSGLIMHVVRRHLPAEDEDEIRTVFVDTLSALYNGGLERFAGRVSLASWLNLVSRRKSLDYIRATYGRRRNPKHYNRLNEFEQQVFQLFYVERLPLEIVVHSLDWAGHSVNIEKLISSVVRVEEVLGRACLKSLDDRHLAKKNGHRSAEFQRYVVQSRVEYDWRAAAQIPDRVLMEKEASRLIARIGKILSQLSGEERRVIELHFQEGMSASKIAQKLNLENERRVYTVIERVVRRMKATLNNSNN